MSHLAWLAISVVASGGGSGARPSHLKSVPPHFTFGPLVAAYIQYSVSKMCLPLWFLAPLLLNPGDEPAGHVDMFFFRCFCL